MPQSEEKDYATASLAIARARLGDVSSGMEQTKGLKEERARSLAQGAIAQIQAADWRLGCCLTNGKRRRRSGTQGPCFLPDRQCPDQRRENARPH